MGIQGSKAVGGQRRESALPELSVLNDVTISPKIVPRAGGGRWLFTRPKTEADHQPDENMHHGEPLT